MNTVYLIGQMEQNANRIESLAAGVSADDSRWKPDSDSWSVLEVICHLRDEERDDFRTRLGIILEGSDREWPPIDPEGWVTSRQYSARRLDESLAGFLEERAVSLEWLRSLQDVDWDRTYQASFGVMRAGDMLLSWLSHDYLHVRQLIELHRALGLSHAGPYRPDYAGDW